MEKLLINTPQNVKIEYTLASLGTRILSFALDYAIILSYLYFSLYIFVDLIEKLTDDWLIYGLYSVIILPAFFYHFFWETLLNGQTPGKRVTKIKVVKLDGTRATIYEYFIRWTMSIVDIWMLTGLVGVISIILSKNSQRIGDLAAGTTVINLKQSLQLSATIFEKVPDQYTIKYPSVINLSDKDLNIIKKNYKKAVEHQDEVLMKKLADKVKRVLEINTIEENNSTFIRNVLQDYYYTFRN